MHVDPWPDRKLWIRGWNESLNLWRSFELLRYFALCKLLKGPFFTTCPVPRILVRLLGQPYIDDDGYSTGLAFSPPPFWPAFVLLQFTISDVISLLLLSSAQFLSSIFFTFTLFFFFFFYFFLSGSFFFGYWIDPIPLLTVRPASISCSRGPTRVLSLCDIVPMSYGRLADYPPCDGVRTLFGCPTRSWTTEGVMAAWPPLSVGFISCSVRPRRRSQHRGKGAHTDVDSIDPFR